MKFSVALAPEDGIPGVYRQVKNDVPREKQRYMFSWIVDDKGFVGGECYTDQGGMTLGAWSFEGGKLPDNTTLRSMMSLSSHEWVITEFAKLSKIAI